MQFKPFFMHEGMRPNVNYGTQQSGHSFCLGRKGVLPWSTPTVQPSYVATVGQSGFSIKENQAQNVQCPFILGARVSGALIFSDVLNTHRSHRHQSVLWMLRTLWKSTGSPVGHSRQQPLLKMLVLRFTTAPCSHTRAGAVFWFHACTTRYVFFNAESCIKPGPTGEWMKFEVKKPRNIFKMSEVSHGACDSCCE